MVLKYRSCTGTNTQYYNLVVNCNRRTEKIQTNFRIRAFFIRTTVKQQVCVQLRTYADNVALPAVARRTAVRRAAIDRYHPPAGPTAATYVAVNRPTDGQTETDRQTDRQTDRRRDRRTRVRCIDPAAHSVLGVSAMPNSHRPPDTRRSCLRRVWCADVNWTIALNVLRLRISCRATVLSCRESSSHRRLGRNTDKTVLSCLAWR